MQRTQIIICIRDHQGVVYYEMEGKKEEFHLIKHSGYGPIIFCAVYFQRIKSHLEYVERI